MLCHPCARVLSIANSLLGKLSDKYGRKLMVYISSGIMAFAMILLLLATLSDSPPLGFLMVCSARVRKCTRMPTYVRVLRACGSTHARSSTLVRSSVHARSPHTHVVLRTRVYEHIHSYTVLRTVLRTHAVLRACGAVRAYWLYF